ncbi:alpha/beta hydrolase-fold protein [Pseudarthrobacter sp. H3Y2-7]|uniref:alpha/beta hydrolase n=1 Tax=Pseudarthrobacter naphthalenicus TaxID=3031328 RepID=UPI0023AFC9C8|nr:alpha/beta hydrolase-fold protein [Pseudarthrobacter sp. H3Y2-7]MDE8669064.1 alpha/beta hydrolase-fold protein [Pseudarthrobacter sp. H3Y2-7]
MDWIADIRLTDGPVYWSAWVLGAAAAVYLVWRPQAVGRRRWYLGVAATLAVAAGLVLLVHWILIYLTSVFPDDLPSLVLAWVYAGVTALLVVLLRLRADSWRRRTLDILALLTVVLLAAVQINAYFGLNRTVADLTGTALTRIPPLEQELQRQPGHSALPLAGWTPAGELPPDGVIRAVSIPGTTSGLQTRTSYVYLPPAYFAANRPSLPVLVLVPGQPGGPADWLSGGALLPRMAGFANRHGGVAPVVVVVDPNGSQSANTLCMDSDLARADTYLAVDVPHWISATLDVDTDARQWAVGGFSFGATCAVQLVTRHPDVYTGFLAFASEREPALAKERQKTVDAAFHGDTAAFDAQLPLTLLKERRYEGKVAYFAAGATDPEFVANLQTLATAARGAGFTVESDVVQRTGHSWDMLTPGMDNGLELLTRHWGWEH